MLYVDKQTLKPISYSLLYFYKGLILFMKIEANWFGLKKKIRRKNKCAVNIDCQVLSVLNAYKVILNVFDIDVDFYVSNLVQLAIFFYFGLSYIHF